MKLDIRVRHETIRTQELHNMCVSIVKIITVSLNNIDVRTASRTLASCHCENLLEWSPIGIRTSFAVNIDTDFGGVLMKHNYVFIIGGGL